MLGEDKHLIVNMEHAVPATTISSSSLSTLSEFIDYSAVATDRRTAGMSGPTYHHRLAYYFL